MTASMAGKKYNVLKKGIEGDEEDPFFQKLRREKRSFHHQPVVASGTVTRNSEYFWTMDLKPEAERRGWKERRGRKRRASDDDDEGGGGGGGGGGEEDASHRTPPSSPREKKKSKPSPRTPKSKLDKKQLTAV